MERLSNKNLTKECNDPWDYCGLDSVCKRDCHKPTPCKLPKIVHRLAEIEDILGDDYDLERLRELVEADREGQCVVLQVKPGEKVIPKQSPYRKPEIVDCVTIYTGGRITYGFHEIGMRNEWVDRWEEEEADNYVKAKEN